LRNPKKAFKFASSKVDVSNMGQKLEEVILYLIDQTSRAAKQYSQREFDRLGLGITVEQWILLKLIEEEEGLSQSELATKSNRDPAAVTRTLDLLEQKGLTQRDPTPGNRRQYQVALTAPGKAFIAANMALVESHRSKSIAGFSNDELAALRAMLLRIQRNMG